MEKVLIVYKTDNWHSYASRDIIGVATSTLLAWNLISLQAAKEGYEFDMDTVVKDQTQGYEGDGEFAMEEVELDTLL